MRVVADSYAWIEIFSGSREGANARREMEESARVLSPDIVLAEVARKYFREGMTEAVVSRRLAAILEASETVPIDESIALGAARASAELERKARKEGLAKPGLFDAVLIATARSYGAKLLTGDLHFRDLAEVIWLGRS